MSHKNKLPFELDYEKFDIPESATKTITLNMLWVWYVPSTKDSDGNDIKFNLSYKCGLKYGDFYHGTGKVGDQTENVICKETIHPLALDSVVTIDPPSRTPMGYIQITNSSDEAYLSGFTVTKIGAANPAITTEIIEGVEPNATFTAVVDVGNYDVTFMHGTDPTAMTQYIYTGDYIEVNKDEVVTLDSEYDFWEK